MNLDSLLDRIKTLEDCDFGQGAAEAEIDEAEKSLGIKLPEEYVDFLRRVGWVSVGGLELFGLGKEVPKHLNLVSATMKERHKFRPHIPTFLIPLMADGFGNHYCLFIEGPDTGKVSFWDHEHKDAEQQQPEIVGSGLINWLNEHINDIQNDE